MKKLGVYLLTAAMLLSIVFGGAAIESVYATDQDINSALSLSVNNGTNATGMEIGDEVVVEVKLANGIGLTEAGVTGILEYDHDIFEVIKPGHIAPIGASIEIGWDKNTGVFRLGTSGSTITTTSGNETIATITLKVKKAVKETTTIKYTDTEFVSNGDTYTGDVKVDITNSKKDSRIFEFEMESEVTENDQSDFIIPVRISANTGFNTMGITVKYENGLIFQSVELSSEMKAYTQIKLETPSSGEVKLAIVTSEDINLVDSDLMYLKFRGDRTAATSDTANIEVKVTSIDNQSEVGLTGAGVAKTCKVNLKEALKIGDVNGDGDINLVDASYILQQYNGIRELDSEQKVRAETHPSGGTITLMDALAIMKYYNGALKGF